VVTIYIDLDKYSIVLFSHCASNFQKMTITFLRWAMHGKWAIIQDSNLNHCILPSSTTYMHESICSVMSNLATMQNWILAWIQASWSWLKILRFVCHTRTSKHKWICCADIWWIIFKAASIGKGFLVLPCRERQLRVGRMVMNSAAPYVPCEQWTYQSAIGSPGWASAVFWSPGVHK
jgi:hypothetical protein